MHLALKSTRSGGAGFPAIYETPSLSRFGLPAVPAVLVHFGLAFVLLGGVLLAGETWAFTPTHALLALAIFAYALLMVLLRDPLIFFLSFSLFTNLAPMVASSTYLEYGNFISEQGTSGYASGATARLAFYCLVFILGIYIAARLVLNRLRVRATDAASQRFFHYARALYVAVLLGAAVLLVTQGSPLLRGEDRFAYWASLPSVFSRLPYLIAMMSFLIVAAVAVSPSKKKLLWCMGLLAAGVISLVLFSEKFTGLYSIFVLSITGGYCAALYQRGVKFRPGRLVLLCLVVATALLGVATVGYMVFYGYTTETVLPKLADRALALNAHVWFGTDRSLQSGAPHGPWTALFPQPSYTGLNGNQQIMYLVAPSDYVDRMIAGRLRFANAGFPLAVWVLGYSWAALYFLTGGLLTGLVLGYLMFGVAHMRVLTVLFGLNALRQLSNSVLVGEPSDLYKPLAIATWVFIAADLAWYSYRRNRSSVDAAPGRDAPQSAKSSDVSTR